jgi:predicted Zn-dependent peptidase
MQLIADEIKYLKKFGVKQAELNEKRVKFISDFYLDQSDDNWCQLLSLSSFYNTTVMIDGLDDLLQKVTVSDVQQAAVNYIKAFSIFYSGQKDEVNNLIFTQKLQ